LTTLTTRFVFPQFSLEGKRVWIVGMAPRGLPRVVAAKYAVATLASLSVTLGLMLLSCWMLQMPPWRTAYFAAAVIVMTFALNGLATGLGVLYPNLREDNPSRIVSGFGGTLCLVLSFVYIVASVLLLALGTPWSPDATVSPPSIVAGVAGFLALSLATGWFPFQLGITRARRFEA
jgi:ABC-2 type transport system permease protein